MADVIHRTTLEYRGSVHTPDFPEPEWKHEPDLSAVASVPSIYWKAPADWEAPSAGPVPMTQPERDVVDANIATAVADAGSTEADTGVATSNDGWWQTVRELVENTVKTHNKLANRVREVERALNDVKNTSGGSDNIRAAIPLPSVDVIGEGPAPGTFTRLQNNVKANEIADLRQDLQNKEGQI